MSLDLHANVTPAMVEHADAIAIFRTYPHVDMEDTGARTHRMLQGILERGPLAKAYRQVPYLTPLSAQCTHDEPNRSLYRYIESLDAPDLSVDYACGFRPPTSGTVERASLRTDRIRRRSRPRRTGYSCA